MLWLPSLSKWSHYHFTIQSYIIIQPLWFLMSFFASLTSEICTSARFSQIQLGTRTRRKKKHFKLILCKLNWENQWLKLSWGGNICIPLNVHWICIRSLYTTLHRGSRSNKTTYFLFIVLILPHIDLINSVNWSFTKNSSSKLSFANLVEHYHISKWKLATNVFMPISAFYAGSLSGVHYLHTETKPM